MAIDPKHPDPSRQTNLLDLLGLGGLQTPADTLEEARARDASEPSEDWRPLTDVELFNGGYVGVKAYVKSARAQKSDAARRKAKQREKEEAEGRVPFSASVPLGAAPILREITRKLKGGELQPDDLLQVIPEDPRPAPAPEVRFVEVSRPVPVPKPVLIAQPVPVPVPVLVDVPSTTLDPVAQRARAVLRSGGLRAWLLRRVLS